MSIKITTPGIAVRRSLVRHVFRTPAPDTLVVMLLIVIAMVASALSGLALGAL